MYSKYLQLAEKYNYLKGLENLAQYIQWDGSNGFYCPLKWILQNKITISKGEETEGIGKSYFLHHLAKNKLTRKFTEALKGLIKMRGGFFKAVLVGSWDQL